ncbi:methylamine utilization protein [Alteromonas sp. CYL-A6]|uniref:methylamine utilization protein n=1 Tax=Alteromonas nitratireducens TaxID=3390813 RepID=UPI0034C3DE54
MTFRRFFLLLATLLLSPGLMAHTLTISVTEPDGTPVGNAVVVLTPDRALTDAERNQPQSAPPAIMNQINKQFVPHVLAVQSHTTVSFPNSDNIFHHVYSFSPARQFELKLYKEAGASAITFDEAGVVDLGCNIHDWMLGFIYVTDTPYFATTPKGGEVTLTVPADTFTLSVWHPRMHEDDIAMSRTITVNKDDRLSVSLTQPLYPATDSENGLEEY